MTVDVERAPAPPASESSEAPEASADGHLGDPRGHAEGRLLVTAVAITFAACLPLARVIDGLGFLRPVTAAILLSTGLGWLARRLRTSLVANLVTAAALSVVGWLLFVTFVFHTDTAVAGFLPTTRSLEGLARLWGHGMVLLRTRAAPVLPEAGILLLTVTAVWVVAHIVERLLVRLRAPLQAAVVALLLWTFPLALTPGASRAWPWAVPLLTALLVALVLTGHTDLRRWGSWSRADTGHPLLRHAAPTATVVGVLALVTGVLLAGSLPGFGDPGLMKMQGADGPGSTLIENPIVQIRRDLASQGSQPLLRTFTPQPVYLRVTSLDVYNDLEEWRNDGIQPSPIRGGLPTDDIAVSDRVEMTVTPQQSMPHAVLVPAPYAPRAVRGRLSDKLEFDARLATFTLREDETLLEGESYTVTAAVPAPPNGADIAIERGDPRLTALPGNVPDEVARLARGIVEDAGAATPYAEAVAIQNHLRTWTYSLDVRGGHSGRAMAAFISDKEGYCEQFAGTMAVMLRTLGIPTRVAVGFTPGDPVSSTTTEAGVMTEYVVAPKHAHAWVEVRTRDYGWVLFEPTPRRDGNVLVPTPEDPAPEQLEAQRGLQQPTPPPPDTPAETRPTEDVIPPGGDGQSPGRAAAPPPGSERTTPLPALAALALTVVGLTALQLHRRSRTGALPSQRVLGAWRVVQRIGRGLGVVPATSETEREYAGRLVGAVGPDAAAAGAARLLADGVAAARYAPELAAGHAAAAEQSADELLRAIRRSLGPIARVTVSTRGAVSAAAAAARALVGRALRKS